MLEGMRRGGGGGGGWGGGRICNNHPWDGMTHLLMNIHELTPHNQAAGLADSSFASAELKILSKAESARHNRSERKQSDLDDIVAAYLSATRSLRHSPMCRSCCKHQNAKRLHTLAWCLHSSCREQWGGESCGVLRGRTLETCARQHCASVCSTFPCMKDKPVKMRMPGQSDFCSFAS